MYFVPNLRDLNEFSQKIKREDIHPLGTYSIFQYTLFELSLIGYHGG